MNGKILTAENDAAVREMEQKMVGMAQQQAMLFERHFSTAHNIYTNLVVQHSLKQINYQVVEEKMKQFAVIATEAATVFLARYNMRVEIRSRGEASSNPEEPKSKGYVEQY